MFPLRSQPQAVPLGLLQECPARLGIPGILVEEATERTLTDQFSTVQRGFGRRVQKHEQRSPQAALLVRGSGDSKELVCQNADALPRNL
ncbi:hypothetical protein DESA109040_23085 [Deinococcus saxicola]